MEQRKQAGFTLLEVVFAVLILVVGFLAMAEMQVMAISTNSKARDITKSTALAQSRTEELMSLPDSDSAWVPTDYVEETSPDPRFKIFRKVIAIPSTNFKRLVIKVEWGSGFWKKKTEIAAGR